MEVTVIDLSLTVFLHYGFGMLSYLPARHNEQQWHGCVRETNYFPIGLCSIPRNSYVVL